MAGLQSLDKNWKSVKYLTHYCLSQKNTFILIQGTLRLNNPLRSTLESYEQQRNFLFILASLVCLHVQVPYGGVLGCVAWCHLAKQQLLRDLQVYGHSPY